MFELNQKLLTINNYVGEIIEIKNKEITVFYKKDNSLQYFKEYQFDSLKYMIKKSFNYYYILYYNLIFS